MIKMEIDVPAGATKIDIGPVLEPILARLVSLERASGYNDLSESDSYPWRRVKDKNRPVLTSDIQTWIKHAHKERELDTRMSVLTHGAIATFLKKEGWELQKLDHNDADYLREGYEYPGLQRAEKWIVTFMKTPGWGGSRRPFETRVVAMVPYPQRYEEAYRIHRVGCLISKIQEARYEISFTKSTTEHVLAEIEACAHPLIRLADCADDV